jgi:hypothetical protein
MLITNSPPMINRHHNHTSSQYMRFCALAGEGNAALQPGASMRSQVPSKSLPTSFKKAVDSLKKWAKECVSPNGVKMTTRCGPIKKRRCSGASDASSRGMSKMAGDIVGRDRKDSSGAESTRTAFTGFLGRPRPRRFDSCVLMGCR